MERRWKTILDRYGQPVILLRGGARTTGKALIQPMLEREREGRSPSPLGLADGARFLYLGPAELPLDMDTVVTWAGRDYRVQTAHLAGEGVCPHRWAVLRPGEEVSP